MVGAQAGDARRAQGTLSRLHFPACPLLKRACSLFLDRSSSLDGSLQGPGRGTKRYSQDSPPYTAPLSPKLPKNDRHPLEGEHSVSLPKAGCPQHPVLAAAGAHLPCPTEPWLQGAALLVPGMGCAWYSRGEWMSCCVVRQVPHTDVSGMWNAVGIPSNPDTHHLTLYNLVYLPTLCMGLTVLSLPSCLSPSAPRFFPEGLLQPIVQMLMCSCTASNLLTFPRISSCSSQAPLKQPGGVTGSTSSATPFSSCSFPESLGIPLGHVPNSSCRSVLFGVGSTGPLHALVGDFQKVWVAGGLPELSNLQ